METLIEFGLLVLGFLLGIFWFSVIILPVAYGFPRAFWWCLRGRAKWRAPFAYLITPIIWSVVFFVVAFVLVSYFRPTANFLMASGGFSVGQMAGIVLSAVRCVFSKSTHRDMNADFLSFMRPYMTGEGTPLEIDTSNADDSSDRAASQMEKVIHDFGALLEHIEPITFYDVSALPHPKDTILKSILFAIMATQDQQQRSQLASALPFLAQFQPNVGANPISSFPVNMEDLNRRIESGETSIEESAAEISNAASQMDHEKRAALKAAYDEETRRFLQMAEEAQQVR